MKKLLILSAVLISTFGVSQTTTIPDANFEQALISLGYDTGNVNGSIATSNIADLTYLDVTNQNISDLTGIEDFTGLTELYIGGNQLTSLNLNNNNALISLFAYANQLTSVDLSNNTALNVLQLAGNQLTSLDVSNNTFLEQLYFNQNQLTSINLSNNTSLNYLWGYDNLLTSLDIRNGNNANIWGFDVTNNPDLTCIYVDDASYMQETWSNFIDTTSTFANNETECSGLNLLDNSFELDLNIYPNPTDKHLFIEGNKNPIVTTIYNLIGKEVLSTKNTNRVDVNELSKGVYIIRISDGINQTHKKFIKN